MKLFIQYDSANVCVAHAAYDTAWSVVGTVLGYVNEAGVFTQGAEGRWVQWPHETLSDLPRIGDAIDPGSL